MSDITPASHNHRKNNYVLGTSRRKKYLKIMLLVLFTACAAIGYFAISSGILADENPEIPKHLIQKIHDERRAHNLPPVQVSSTLAHQALLTSQTIRVSPRAYTSGLIAPLDQGTDVIIYPKLSWAMSGINLEPMLFDTWQTSDPGFTANIQRTDLRDVGIGISTDGYNYYIVIKWQ
jgi:uncharacterized protein YkwD